VSERDKLYDKFGKSVPKGTVIFNEGESGHEMYIIHEGKVRITKKIRAMETTLAELERGDFFGEMAILEKEARSATASAATDVKLLVIDEKTFETTIRTNPDVAIRIMRKMAERLRDADHRIENLFIKDTTSKVVDMIGKIAVKEGRKTKDGIVVELPVTNLAGLVGLEVEKTRRVVKNLAAKNFLVMKGDTLTIKNPQNLRKVLDYLELKEQLGDII
jgi:CRP/FNR family transcriptional regulator, cyclic AMP receptor protein